VCFSCPICWLLQVGKPTLHETMKSCPSCCCVAPSLLPDYHLLEEVRRVDDVAHRCRPVAPKPQLPPQLAGLVHEANRHHVRLMLMTPGELA
jgi:hypothetical protein